MDDWPGLVTTTTSTTAHQALLSPSPAYPSTTSLKRKLLPTSAASSSAKRSRVETGYRPEDGTSPNSSEHYSPGSDRAGANNSSRLFSDVDVAAYGRAVDCPSGGAHVGSPVLQSPEVKFCH